MHCIQPPILAKLLLTILFGLIMTGCGSAATPSPAAAIQTATFTSLPTGTISPPTETPTPIPCPADPEQWDLVEVAPNNNYKRIEPACAYDGLSRTVAWLYAIRQGYSRKEAAQKLEFDEFPVEYF